MIIDIVIQGCPLGKTTRLDVPFLSFWSFSSVRYFVFHLHCCLCQMLLTLIKATSHCGLDIFFTPDSYQVGIWTFNYRIQEMYVCAISDPQLVSVGNKKKSAIVFIVWTCLQIDYHWTASGNEALCGGLWDSVANQWSCTEDNFGLFVTIRMPLSSHRLSSLLPTLKGWAKTSLNKLPPCSHWYTFFMQMFIHGIEHVYTCTFRALKNMSFLYHWTLYRRQHFQETISNSWFLSTYLILYHFSSCLL